MIGTNGKDRTTDAKLGRRTLLRLAGVVLFLLAPLVPWAESPATRGPLIAEVSIVGARSVPVEKLQQFVLTKAGHEYNDKIAREDLTRLGDSHLCKPIDIRTEPTSDGRINVIFLVQEYRSTVREVVYRHTKHVSVKELEGITRVHRGMPLDPHQNKFACYEIQEHLRKQGYLFANVSLLEGERETDERVVFNITEGPVVRVRSIDFVGQNELAGAERLRTQIDSSRAFLETLGGKYQPFLVESDEIKLKEYYRNNGYLNVHVSHELQFSDDYHLVDIIFHIQEGKRYRIHDWTVEGTKNFPRDQLASIITLKKGDYYSEGVVGADVRNIADYGGWRGQQLDVKKFVSEVPDYPGLVRVQYVVEDKPPAQVGEVIIVGNTVTKDRIIRRVIPLYPGQTLQYPDLRFAERDLARLNIFEMNPELGIRPTVTVLDNPGPLKDILVKVQDTRTGSLMLGAGVNSSSGLVGSIVLNERNFDLFRLPTSWADITEGRAFRGAGQEFRIEAVPGTQVQRYTVSLREPFLFDQPYSLLSSAYYRDRIFNEYTEGRIGARMDLSHMFTKGFSASVGFRAEDVSVSNVALGAPVDYTSAYGHSTILAPNVSLIYDTRDSYLRPTEGGKAQFSFEQVFGSYTFPIFNVELSRYFTLWERPDHSGKHILAMRSQTSWANGDVPVFERFFAGGYNSIRGFQFRGVGPNVNGFMVGGDFQFINTIEYQIPVRANDSLYFVTFIDSGTVESTASIHDYRVTAGFGLRVSLPMLGPVPLAFDFGFPIVQAKTDIHQLFSFGVGIFR